VVPRVVLLIPGWLCFCAFLRRSINEMQNRYWGGRERTEIPKTKHVEIR
jgi:hypothetical protein